MIRTNAGYLNMFRFHTVCQQLLTIINGYSGKEGLQEAADYMLELLKEFAASKDEELIYF